MKLCLVSKKKKPINFWLSFSGTKPFHLDQNKETFHEIEILDVLYFKSIFQGKYPHSIHNTNVILHTFTKKKKKKKNS